MKIIVQGHEIETKEIYRIVDIEYYKKMFMNRDAGFIIERIGGKPSITIGERIPYESSGYDIRRIRERWERLRKEVESKWNEDKIEIPILNLD